MIDQNMSQPMSLNPKNLILQLLLAADGAPLSTKEATAACAVFGMRENSVRVALVRLSAAGMVQAAGRGSYALGPQAAPLADDLSRWQGAEARVCEWEGGWLMVSTGALGRSDRAALQARERALALAGFRELEPTLYLRPDNLVGHAAAVRERLRRLGLGDGAPVFAARDFDARREQAARQLWDGAALNASYAATRQTLEQWMQGADQLELDVAARESFLLGSEAIRQLVFDPLLPEPLVDVRARRDFTQVVQAYDQMGQAIWRRLLSGAQPGARTQTTGTAWPH
jgi:phenylacetic acid degradation operon negative regulatory protein